MREKRRLLEFLHIDIVAESGDSCDCGSSSHVSNHVRIVVNPRGKVTRLTVLWHLFRLLDDGGLGGRRNVSWLLWWDECRLGLDVWSSSILVLFFDLRLERESWFCASCLVSSVSLLIETTAFFGRPNLLPQ